MPVYFDSGDILGSAESGSPAEVGNLPVSKGAIIPGLTSPYRRYIGGAWFVDADKQVPPQAAEEALQRQLHASVPKRFYRGEAWSAGDKDALRQAVLTLAAHQRPGWEPAPDSPTRHPCPAAVAHLGDHERVAALLTDRNIDWALVRATCLPRMTPGDCRVMWFGSLRPGLPAEPAVSPAAVPDNVRGLDAWAAVGCDLSVHPFDALRAQQKAAGKAAAARAIGAEEDSMILASINALGKSWAYGPAHTGVPTHDAQLQRLHRIWAATRVEPDPDAPGRSARGAEQLLGDGLDGPTADVPWDSVVATACPHRTEWSVKRRWERALDGSITRLQPTLRLDSTIRLARAARQNAPAALTHIAGITGMQLAERWSTAVDVELNMSPWTWTQVKFLMQAIFEAKGTPWADLAKLCASAGFARSDSQCRRLWLAVKSKLPSLAAQLLRQACTPEALVHAMKSMPDQFSLEQGEVLPVGGSPDLAAAARPPIPPPRAGVKRTRTKRSSAAAASAALSPFDEASDAPSSASSASASLGLADDDDADSGAFTPSDDASIPPAPIRSRRSRSVKQPARYQGHAR